MSMTDEDVESDVNMLVNYNQLIKLMEDHFVCCHYREGVDSASFTRSTY